MTAVVPLKLSAKRIRDLAWCPTCGEGPGKRCRTLTEWGRSHPSRPHLYPREAASGTRKLASHPHAARELRAILLSKLARPGSPASDRLRVVRS